MEVELHLYQALVVEGVGVVAHLHLAWAAEVVGVHLKEQKA